MRRLLLIVTLVGALVAALAVGALAFADDQGSDRIADGITIGGISVGGMSQAEAMTTLRDRIGSLAKRPTTVRVGKRRFELTAEEAGLRVRIGRAVKRAHEASREGGFLERGWRQLTGGTVDRDEPAPVEFDEDKVRSFVGSVHAAVSRKPVDAALSMAIDSVSVSPAKKGRRLADRDWLERHLMAVLRDPRADRSIRAQTERIAPEVTTKEVWDANPTVVTVSRSSTTVRVFRRGEMVRSYRVAVGEPKYPTPTGQFSVQTKQVDPPWNVPQSDWAGDLAGQVIPGGDPRNPLIARWIGFNGAVGFHGTASIGSLGTSASHGCVRMSPGDVIDLYERVEVGTPVLVA